MSQKNLCGQSALFRFLMPTCSRIFGLRRCGFGHRDDRPRHRSLEGLRLCRDEQPAQAQAAIEGLNGQSVSGRALVVNLARPRDDSGPRGGGGGGYRSGNGGGYRGGGGRY